MARNAEKAMATLSRWVAMKRNEGKILDQRPSHTSECDDLDHAEKFRRDLVSDITKKVSQIQNAGMGDFRLRDLNDEINKLIREKRHWEARILELGGPDYEKIAPKVLDQEGRELPGNRGYKYFGAARDLPGVRELFQKKEPSQQRRLRGELQKRVDADYYGYRDDDDGLLVPKELKEENISIEKAILAWKNGEDEFAEECQADAYFYAEHQISAEVEENDPADLFGEDSTSVVNAAEKGDKAPASSSDAQTDDFVPDQEEVEEILVERKRRELIQRYVSESLLEEQKIAKTLIGDEV